MANNNEDADAAGQGASIESHVIGGLDALLRASAPESVGAWRQTRFIPLERALRGGRVLIASNRTVALGDVPKDVVAAGTWAPLTIYHHTLVVGYGPPAARHVVEWDRFEPWRGWR